MTYVYIHLPFCLSHCIYCDFAVVLKPSDDRRQHYLKALCQEMTATWAMEMHPFRDQLVYLESIYLGGGTPALYSAAELGLIFDHLRQLGCVWDTATEITMELNPDRQSSSFEAYRDIGINRLSIGVQSLQPNELKRLSRVHGVDNVYNTVQLARGAGFTNISMDLMYGIPEQTLESWHHTLRQYLSFNLEHLSAYGLQVEEGTRLETLLRQGRLHQPDEVHTVAFYHEAQKTLLEAGYHHYEISNWSKPGYESRHNLNYWNTGPFLGFGLGATGMPTSSRLYENTDDWETYLDNSILSREWTDFNQHQQLQNALIFGLRKRSGVSLSQLNARFNTDVVDTWHLALAPWIRSRHLLVENDHLKLSIAGIDVSNAILSEFMTEQQTHASTNS